MPMQEVPLKDRGGGPSASQGRHFNMRDPTLAVVASASRDGWSGAPVNNASPPNGSRDAGLYAISLRRQNKQLSSVEMLAFGLRLADILALVFGGIVADQAGRIWGLRYSGGEWLLTALVTCLSALFVIHQAGIYQPKHLRRLGLRLPAILVATTTGCLAGMACCAMMPVLTPALRVWPLLWMPSATLLMVAVAFANKHCMDWLATSERLTRRLALVGGNEFGDDFVRRVEADSKRAATVLGFYADSGEQVDENGVRRYLGTLPDLVVHARSGLVDAIVLTLPLSDVERLDKARVTLSSLNTDIFIAAEVLDLASKAGHLDRIGEIAVLKISGTPLQGFELLQKDVLDRVLAAAMLVICLPFLMLVALAIKMDSEGPVLFRQPRLGFNNNMFQIYKFRTMYHHLEDLGADQQVCRGDARITRLGGILRKTSIDELPQLLNVLRGEMSLVGPRPHAPNTKAGDQLFQDAVSDYAMRHRVKPGITGWAQVNGWRGETRTRDQIERRVAYDLYYIDNWSLLLDVKILILTATRELNSKVAF